MTLISEALRLADAFRARVVDAFLDLMRPLGLAEVSRSGVAAIARGQQVL